MTLKSKTYAKFETDRNTRRALLACGLWLRAGFVGASAALVGLFQLFGGETTPLSALALMLGGGTLAILGWRRAFSALDRADVPDAGESPARTTARTPAVA